jgi:hypothetical protein
MLILEVLEVFGSQSPWLQIEKLYVGSTYGSESGSQAGITRLKENDSLVLPCMKLLI